MMAKCITAGFNRPAMADSAAQIERDVDNALQKLYATSSAAKERSRIAKAILVFPSIIKAGFLISRIERA